MSGKGSISRMSDECLMTLEFGFPFYIVYQAVMRKFTLAYKTKHFVFSVWSVDSLTYLHFLTIRRLPTNGLHSHLDFRLTKRQDVLIGKDG